MKKILIILLFVSALITSCSTLSKETAEKQQIDVLILPKFEEGKMYGDFPGEAQFFYENYFMESDEYEVAGSLNGNKLYVKDNLALFVTGMGKVNAATSLVSLLTDNRFDFSKALIISTGCAGSATEYATMGDVCIASAVIDYDLGHTADIRDMEDKNSTTWFHDLSYDTSSYKKLNPDLVDWAYNLTKDIELDTTEKTVNFMRYTFNNEEWAVRKPKVLKGTVVSGDNYWKGEYGQNNAVLMTETYNCPDSFIMSEMEDVALGVVLDRFRLLDNYLAIRDSVDTVTFLNGSTPESLWNGTDASDNLASESGIESADIFETAMENNWKVTSKIIEAWLSKK